MTDEAKYISESERAKIPENRFAGPNSTFPINSQEHVYAAAHLIGHAADPSKVKKRVMAIAKEMGYALPEAWQGEPDADDRGSMKSFGDMLVFQGGEIKSLGGGKIGGHAIVFSTKYDPDLTGDYFDSSTDFDIEDGDRRSGYYNHGFDLKLANTKIGTGTFTRDRVGVWLEAQLAERDEYVDAITKMVEDGALGISTGSLPHLVRREAKNKAGTVNYVSNWPVGEWSLTPIPAEPRTSVMPLKMWARANNLSHDVPAAEIKAATNIQSEREFESFLRDAGYSRKDATAIALHGFRVRDARDSGAVTPDSIESRSEAETIVRELKLAQLELRTQGFRHLVSP